MILTIQMCFDHYLFMNINLAVQYIYEQSSESLLGSGIHGIMRWTYQKRLYSYFLNMHWQYMIFTKSN